MDNNKRNALIKASLIFVLLTLIFLSGYQIFKLSNNKSVSQNQISFQGNVPNGQQGNKNANSMPQGQPPSTQGKANSDSNNQKMAQGKMPNSMPKQQSSQSNNGNKPKFEGNGQGTFDHGDFQNRSENSNNYSIEVIIYSIIFLVSLISSLIIVSRKKIKELKINSKFLVPVLIAIALFLRLFIAVLLPSFSSDLNLFKNWAVSAGKSLTGVYSSSRNADYPPLYMYVLAFIGKIGNTSYFSTYFNLLLKLPSILADIITAFFIYRISIKRLSNSMSIILAAFFLFNPAILVDSSVWGQVDSFFTLILILGVYMLSEGKVEISSIFFAASVLMKPQGIIFLPVLFIELVRLKSVKKFVISAFTGLATATIIALPFIITNGIPWVFKLYSGTVGEYPYASVNAFNFFSLIGKNYVSDSSKILGITYHNLGMIFIIIVTIISFVIYIKGNSKMLVPAIALLEICGVFTFASSMHERYLFPAVALSILAYIYLKDRRILIAAIGLSITVFSNTYYVLIGESRGYTPVLVVTSALNVLIFGYLLKVLIDILPHRGGVKID